MQHAVGDRFIPRRNSRPHPYQTTTHCNANSNGVDILSQRSTDGFRRAYEARLENVWGMKIVHDRIFRFSNHKNLGKPPIKRSVISMSQDWPRRNRKKPCIKSPDMTLDLPDFAGSFYKNLLDWGSGGHFAAALKDSVFLWNTETRSTNMLTKYVVGVCTVVKWNLKGNLLAVGNSTSLIEVWNTTSSKVEFGLYCGCLAACDINTVDWHPNSTVLVTGCSNGTLCHVTCAKSSLVRQILPVAHTGQIAMVLTSPDGKYFASCGEDGYVRLWLWSKFKFLFQIDVRLPCRSMAWHPWQPSLLAMGTSSVSVWNIQKQTMQAWHAPKRPAAIHAIAFSSITGEMVVSARIISTGVTPTNNPNTASRETRANSGNSGANSQDNSTTTYQSQIMVLGSLDLVVDWLEVDQPPNIATYYLLWSPDGKKLATAGSDDTLYIWNFLGEEVKEKIAKQGKSILQVAGNGNNHGFCIR